MKLSRRGWNNVLILSIIVFIIALNLPNIFKAAFQSEQQSPYPYLMNPELDTVRIDFSTWSLKRESSGWTSAKSLSISPLELVQRWQSLVGTEVTDETFGQLKPSLKSANTIEIWYLNSEEPQRVTYYQTPQFWLMQNWQQKWIAVSVDSEYLFPVK